MAVLRARARVFIAVRRSMVRYWADRGFQDGLKVTLLHCVETWLKNWAYPAEDQSFIPLNMYSSFMLFSRLKPNSPLAG